MEFPFTVPGHEQIPFELRLSLFGAPKITSQGVPLKKMPGRIFVLSAPNGGDISLQLKPNGLNLFVPKVIYDGREINTTPHLPGYSLVFIYLPVLLLFVGGAIGGACGGAAVYGNFAIFNSRQHSASKIFLSLLVTGSAVLFWLVVAVTINLVIKGDFAAVQPR